MKKKREINREIPAKTDDLPECEPGFYWEKVLCYDPQKGNVLRLKKRRITKKEGE